MSGRSYPSRPPVWYAARFHVEGRIATVGQAVLCPQVLFRPLGFWLWGASALTVVRQLRVGTDEQLVQPVPVQASGFFDPPGGLAFEDLRVRRAGAPGSLSLLDCDQGFLRVSFSGLALHSNQLELATCHLGNQIMLDWEGPLEHAVLWGHTPDPGDDEPEPAT